MSNVKSLADLIGFEPPVIKSINKDGCLFYEVTLREQDLEKIKKAICDSETLLFSGIKIAGNLLDIGQDKHSGEYDPDVKANVSLLLNDLSKVLLSNQVLSKIINQQT